MFIYYSFLIPILYKLYLFLKREKCEELKENEKKEKEKKDS
jgi:hypothetical protein